MSEKNIKEHEHELTVLAKNQEHTMSDRFVGGHVRHREGIDTQRNIYNELKKEFFSFLITTKCSVK